MTPTMRAPAQAMQSEHTAGNVPDTPTERVTSDQIRYAQLRYAQAINFGLTYGVSRRGLAKILRRAHATSL